MFELHLDLYQASQVVMFPTLAHVKIKLNPGTYLEAPSRRTF